MSTIWNIIKGLRNFLRSILNFEKLISFLKLDGSKFHVFAPLYRKLRTLILFRSC